MYKCSYNKEHSESDLFVNRAQELCESRGGRRGLPVLNKPTVSVDVKQLCIICLSTELRSCVKVEMAVVGSPSLISLRFLWT